MIFRPLYFFKRVGDLRWIFLGGIDWNYFMRMSLEFVFLASFEGTSPISLKETWALKGSFYT